MGYIEGLGAALKSGMRSLETSFGQTSLSLAAPAQARAVTAPAGSATGVIAAGGLTINLGGIHIHGNAEPQKVERAVESGVTRALRRKGLA
jgi:hypothetical protein